MRGKISVIIAAAIADPAPVTVKSHARHNDKRVCSFSQSAFLGFQNPHRAGVQLAEILYMEKFHPASQYPGHPDVFSQPPGFFYDQPGACFSLMVYIAVDIRGLPETHMGGHRSCYPFRGLLPFQGADFFSGFQNPMPNVLLAFQTSHPNL